MLTIAPYKKDIKEKDTAGIKQLQSRQSLSGRTGVDRVPGEPGESRQPKFRKRETLKRRKS